MRRLRVRPDAMLCNLRSLVFVLTVHLKYGTSGIHSRELMAFASMDHHRTLNARQPFLSSLRKSHQRKSRAASQSVACSFRTEIFMRRQLWIVSACNLKDWCGSAAPVIRVMMKLSD